MAEDPTIPASRRFERNHKIDRRRTTDKPQPLDYITRELVSEIIDNQELASAPQKSFFQRLLNSK